MLGRVLAITRSDAVVHETHGVYSDMRQHGSVGMFFSPGIDTRFFLDRWKCAFAVTENERLSLQFFDAFGVAAHKVYITDDSSMLAYAKLVARYRSDNQGKSEPVRVSGTRLNTPVDLDPVALRDSWLKIRDVHEGPRLVRAHGGDYQAVYSALGEEFAQPLESWSVELLLQQLSSDQVPCMIFAMNKSAVQAYAGRVKKLLRTGPWFNVLDPTFNLHLKTSEIGRAWYVRKPSDDGWITTLHAFDRHGREVLVVADNRMRGMRELSPWRETLRSIAESNAVESSG